MKKSTTDKKPPNTKLRNVRIAAGLSQIALAEILGITASMVCQQERRGCTTTIMAKQYARALNCEPIDLIEL